MNRVRELARTLLLALVLSFAIKAVVVEAYWIPTGSMKPTIMENDRVLTSKISYLLSDPAAGDIVVFTPPDAVHTEIRRFVKRVIGVPGDRIEIRGGTVFRNGVALKEPYIRETPDYTLAPFRVPEGRYFVLGDNRRNSFDSHVWGFVPRERITAKALLRYWPPGEAGLLQ